MGAAERFRSQWLHRRRTSVEAVVRHLLAVQAQEARSVRLALRARGASGSSDALVTSWLMRGTLHTVCRDERPRLCDLLETHRAMSGVPGLVDANLCGPGEPTACTPLDAIRTMFSSAIDALVMGRFLVMKDYWLLRSDEGDR